MDGGAKQVPQPLELQREHAHASVGDMWSIYSIFWLPRQWTRVAGSREVTDVAAGVTVKQTFLMPWGSRRRW